MKRDSLPIESLPAWLRFNGIKANGVAFQKVVSARGSGIVATQDQMSSDNETEPPILLEIPSDLILSLETVHNYAKSDRYLREVLEAVGHFGRTARGAIMIFLLVQITHSSPDYQDKVGVSSPWTEYIKFLPSSFPLPTFYTAEEQMLLRGTSLEAAVEAKIASLEREFEHILQSTDGIVWCQQRWWAVDTGKLTIDDWKYVDAAYRSRMVDLPGSGLAMVPCIDMANHVFGDAVNARYDQDSDGAAVLQLRSGKSLHIGDELTISYGDEKPASEMIFSYGFLEDDRTEAKEVFLGLEVPDDDPLGAAKKMFCREAPGIRIFTESETPSHITWDSTLIWWACVNEEDGLHIDVAQTTDGQRELETSWKGTKIQEPTHLRELLAADPSWDIFQLRAIVLLLQRLQTQLAVMQETEEIISTLRDKNPTFETIFRPEVLGLVSRLRDLEAGLLQGEVEILTNQQNTLLESDTVLAYLNQQSQDADEADDFS
ncbi:hypothetical protein N7510_002868 [Penicillium lagena]|uniref:uncharacterized protein n=1 Tax=Penicillium lagena TaxID=94218 RepID=UPI0025421781|nr:uncharacterized protein N7510_002868 [Penicillium lagena]KAJ5618884.1 hypothetical protein N7510_002868 [Penicillium lagena]